MKSLKLALKSTTVIYVTRDSERALGLPRGYKNYYIVTNQSPQAKKTGPYVKNILYIKEKAKLDTAKLLEHPKTVAFISKQKNAHILVFKSTTQIEKICHRHGWKLLNPPAALATQIEEKISQLTWLGPLTVYLPPHKVITCKQLTWSGTPYIIQFNHAHTGSGTTLIEHKNQIIELQNTFPNREVRVTEYITGPAFTSNNVVWGKNVLCGNSNYQITGLPPFTTGRFATVGNDWELPNRILTKKQITTITTIAKAVGKQLVISGWKGLFGIDVIVDAKTGKVYLIEINARQPASTTYESELQARSRQKTITSTTTFEAHVASLLQLPYQKESLTLVTKGAQIIQRITPEIKTISRKTSNRLSALSANLIAYKNTDVGSDLLRIQTKTGIMDQPENFNSLGEKITDACVLSKTD